MKKSFYIGYRGQLEAYIYIWFSKAYRIVYVGQTNAIYGVVERANQHVTQPCGTLYSRVYDEGLNLNDIDDFVLLSYPLPREKRFLSEDTGYRISVEYLVQKILNRKRKDVREPYKCISNVSPGPFVGMEKMLKIAEYISNDFIEIYTENN